MKILFDHNVPKRFRRNLMGHLVSTTREMHWDALANGALLRSATGAGFDAFLCIDKKIEYEQNLKSLPLPVIVLDARSNAIPDVAPFAPVVLKLLESPLEKLLYVIAIDGRVHEVREPRTKRDK